MEKEALNENQLAFVRCDRNALLLASAGTGKTKSVAAKVSRLINEKGMDSSQILCLSFTNKACEQMRERILTDVSGAAFKSTIKTFHAFCFQIIAEEKQRTTGLFPEQTIYDEDDCLEVVKSFSEADAEWVQKFINAIKEARIVKEIFTGNDVSDCLQAADALTEEEKAALRKSFGKRAGLLEDFFAKKEIFLRSYQGVLFENHASDFNDLVSGVYLLFRNPSTVKRWQDKYSFICIDEAQDTSLAEYRLLKTLFGQSQIALCGDFFQTIYQWRGSKPEEIIRDYRKFYAPTLFSFDINYRSTQTLVDAGFHLLQSLFGPKVETFYPDGVVAARSEVGLPIEIKRTADLESEAKAIYDKVFSLRNTYELSSMCVLTRSNNYGLDIATYFRSQAEKLNCFLIGDLKFYRQPEIKDALAFMRLLINPHDSLSVARIANKYIAGVGPVTLNAIFKDLKEATGLNLSDFINIQTLISGDPYAPLLKALEQGSVVVFDTETTGLDVNRDEIVQISAERIDGEGRVLDAFNRFIRPSIPVGSSTSVHGYTDEFLANHGEEAVLVLRDFISFIKDCLLVGHNVSFDCGILFSELRRNHLLLEHFSQYFDTCVMARAIYPTGPKNYKLSYLSQEYFHFEHASSHQADDDVAATVELLLKMTKESLVPGTLLRQQIISKYAGRFRKFAVALDNLTCDYDRLTIDQLVEKIISVMQIREHYAKVERAGPALDNLIAIAMATKDSGFSTREAIQDFLNTASLSNTEIDALCKNKAMLPIITVHQAKGAEFKAVFLAGVSDNHFPNYYGDPEEEKRIFYVAVTRAKERLFISYACSNDYGYSQAPSRYLNFLPLKDVVWD